MVATENSKDVAGINMDSALNFFCAFVVGIFIVVIIFIDFSKAGLEYCFYYLVLLLITSLLMIIFSVLDGIIYVGVCDGRG